MMEKKLQEKLVEIQTGLRAPKGLKNTFQGYDYRNVEAILEAAKPLLKATGTAILLSDEVELVGERYYVKATATLTDGENSISVSALAREQSEKKGNDEAQVTGSASSYARKYALSGLFAIDNNKDPDSCDNRDENPFEKPAPRKAGVSPQTVASCERAKIEVVTREGEKKTMALGEMSDEQLEAVIKKNLGNAAKQAEIVLQSRQSKQ